MAVPWYIIKAIGLHTQASLNIMYKFHYGSSHNSLTIIQVSCGNFSEFKPMLEEIIFRLTNVNIGIFHFITI